MKKIKQSMKKDKEKRSLFHDYEKKRRLLKAISQNLHYSKDLRWKAELQLSELPKRSSVTQIHKRCLLTGRARFLIKGFNLSRFMLRKIAQEGQFSGIRKACW